MTLPDERIARMRDRLYDLYVMAQRAGGDPYEPLARMFGIITDGSSRWPTLTPKEALASLALQETGPLGKLLRSLADEPSEIERPRLHGEDLNEYLTELLDHEASALRILVFDEPEDLDGARAVVLDPRLTSAQKAAAIEAMHPMAAYKLSHALYGGADFDDLGRFYVRSCPHVPDDHGIVVDDHTNRIVHELPRVDEACYLCHALNEQPTVAGFVIAAKAYVEDPRAAEDPMQATIRDTLEALIREQIDKVAATDPYRQTA